MSRYLSHRLTPARLPLYWFLLGLQSLITYTCSWEMQAWLEGESPFDKVSPPTAGAFLELDLGGGVAGSCRSEVMGRRRLRAAITLEPPDTRPRVLW